MTDDYTGFNEDPVEISLKSGRSRREYLRVPSSTCLPAYFTELFFLAPLIFHLSFSLIFFIFVYYNIIIIFTLDDGYDPIWK